MIDQPNPLYHKRVGKGQYNALIEFDGMNRFAEDGHSFHMHKRTIATLEGATLRYSNEREVCDLKVYHPTETDCDGDTCSIAVYDFYNLKLQSMVWGSLYFTGLLTAIRHHGNTEPVVTDRDGYPYLPPVVKTGVLPLPIKLQLWVPQEGEDDE